MATSYLVFAKYDAPKTWEEVGVFTAASAEAAQAKAALAHGDNTYIATPARGVKPTTFKVEPRAVAVKTTP